MSIFIAICKFTLSLFSIDNIIRVIEEKLVYHVNKNKIIDEIKSLDVNNYTGIYE